MKKISLVLFVIALISAAGLIVFKINDGIKIDSSVLSLINTDKNREFIRDLSDSASEELSRKVFFLVLDEEEKAGDAAENLIQKAQISEIFEEISSGSSQELENDYFDRFFKQRYFLLSDAMRSIITSEDASGRLIAYHREKIFAPMPDFYADFLNNDPLMLFHDKTLELIGGSRWISHNGLLMYPGDSTAILITATLKDNPFVPKTQSDLENFIAEVKKDSESPIFVTAVARYAKDGFDKGKKDAGFLGTVSLIAVTVLLFAVFKSFGLVLAGLVPIVCGLIFAFAALLFSPVINTVALSMGAIFVGIAIDYSFHYLLQSESNPNKRLKAVFSGLTLSVLTTALGFCAFFMTPVIGLRHVAVMAVFGLLGAYLSVVILLPSLKIRATPLSFRDVWRNPYSFPLPLFFLLAALIVTVSFFGIRKIKYDDGIENWTLLSPELTAEEAVLRRFIPGTEANKFIVVKADSPDGLLDSLSKVSLLLHGMKKAGVIENYRSESQKFISQKEAETNARHLLDAINQNDGAVLKYLSGLGFASSVLQDMVSEISAPPQPLAGEIGNASIVFLDNVKNEDALRELADGETVFYINRIEEITSVLENYRRNLVETTVVAAAIIFIFLLLSVGFTAATVPILVLLLTQAVLGYLGVRQNIMHSVGQLLVLGIGVDYSVFRAKSRKPASWTNLSVGLAAATSLLSFGILVFAQTPALKFMGQVVVPGIILSYLLSFIVSKRGK